MANSNSELMNASHSSIQISFPLPKAPETNIHLHLTINAVSLLLFLTTALNGDTSTAPPLGSFVYALPNASISATSNSSQRSNICLENECRSATFYAFVCLRILGRVHDPTCKIVSAQDRKACLCR